MVSRINRLRKSRETFGQATGEVGRPAPNAAVKFDFSNGYSDSQLDFCKLLPSPSGRGAGGEG